MAAASVVNHAGGYAGWWKRQAEQGEQTGKVHYQFGSIDVWRK